MLPLTQSLTPVDGMKALPGLIAARRLKRKEKNTGQLQVHRQLPCYDFCLEAGVGKVVTRWLNTVNIFPTSSTVFIHLTLRFYSMDDALSILLCMDIDNNRIVSKKDKLLMEE